MYEIGYTFYANEYNKVAMFCMQNNLRIVGIEPDSEGRRRYQIQAMPETKAILEIVSLKQQLADTDYQAIKYAEHRLTDSEYALIGEQREAWRMRINELEQQYGL